MNTIFAIAPFVIAGSILPTWTAIVIGLLGTGRPLRNAGAFIAGNLVFRLGMGTLLVIFFSAALPDSGNLRLNAGSMSPLVPLIVGVVLLGLGVVVWRLPAPAEGRTFIDRAVHIHPRASFLAGMAAVAAPGVQYAYFIGGIAAITETIPGTVPRLAALAVFAVTLQWMLVSPILVYLVFRDRAERTLDRGKSWLRAHSRRLGGGVVVAAGIYFIAMAIREMPG